MTILHKCLQVIIVTQSRIQLPGLMTVCDVDLDEDEMQRFLSGNNETCPYYQLDDEYAVVKHQAF